MRVRIHVYTAARDIPQAETLRPGRALIYHLLKRGDRELGERLHAHGLPGRTSRGIAPFGQSGIRLRAGGPGAGWVEIGTPMRDIARAWLRGLDGIDYIDWGGAALRVHSAEVIHPPPELDSGRAVWTTLTPVHLRTAREHAETVFPGDPQYVGCLGRNMRRRLDAFGIPGGVTVDVVRFGERRSFVTASSDTAEGASTGCPITVRVKGSPDALRALWCSGIGQKTAAGFGWIGDDRADES